jgi:putative methionine-R-sulfoxide reductase with GAF domain
MKSADSILSRLKGRHFPNSIQNSFDFANALLPFSDLFYFIFRFETIGVLDGKVLPLPLRPRSRALSNTEPELRAVEDHPDAEIRELFEAQNCAYSAAISKDGLFCLGIKKELYSVLANSSEFDAFYFQLRALHLSIAANRQLETINLEHKILNDVQLKITASLDKTEVLNAILDGLQNLVGYDAAGIFIDLEGKSGVEQVIARGYSESKLSLFREKKIHGVTASIYEEKKPINIGDVREDPRYFNAREETRSQLSVPMFKGKKVIGVFTLEKDHTHFYAEENIPFLQTLSDQAVIALNNAALYQDSLQKQRLEKDMIDAAAIQSTLLLKRAPRFNETDISLLYRANRYVGGDIYDIIKTAENSFYLNIGDVSGKGAPAALLMAVLFA